MQTDTERLSRRLRSARLRGSIVGHELRAPVAAALMHLAIARRQIEGGADGAISSALDTVRDELQRMDRLIGRLTELWRDGRPTIVARWIDLGAVAREAVGRALAADPDMRPHLTADVGDGLAGWWDATAVAEIMENLLINAGKFGAGRPIRMLVERLPAGARIVVQDEGIGIPAAEHQRIFARGFRGAASGRAGLGLGLWLVSELSRAHGGDVTVQSAPGQGTTFTVVLRETDQARAM
jgi:signal transduction histidine kinase